MRSTLLAEFVGSKRSARAALAAKPPACSAEADEPDDVERVYLRNDVLHGSQMLGKKKVDVEVHKYIVDAPGILNRGVIIYGAGGSGKTYIMDSILHTLHTAYPIVIVFCPTSSENGSYENRVPMSLIHETVEISTIKEIYERQEMAANVFRRARKIEPLSSLFDRVASSQERNQRSAIARGTDDKAVLDGLIKLYRIVINNNLDRLRGDPTLNDEEFHVVSYINFNPRILVIFDDAMTELQAIIKTKGDGDLVRNFFFKGRHVHITHFYLFQDDGKLDTGIRKNAWLNIFTSAQVAQAFFDRPANNFSKATKQEATAIINTVFSDEHKDKYFKLIYKRDVEKFFYTYADKPRDFRVCSDLVWKYCQSVEGENDVTARDNKYHGRFNKRVVDRSGQKR